jgi:hypothetical protein
MALATQETVVPWVQKLYPARGKHPARVEFHFSPAYVSKLWNREPAFSRETRSGESPARREDLLLDDIITIQGASIFVRAWLVPADDSDLFHLRIEISATQRLPRNAQVTLHWDRHTYNVSLRAGEMLFEDISPPDFSRLKGNLPTRRLRMSFEFEERRRNGRH